MICRVQCAVRSTQKVRTVQRLFQNFGVLMECMPITKILHLSVVIDDAKKIDFPDVVLLAF